MLKYYKNIKLFQTIRSLKTYKNKGMSKKVRNIMLTKYICVDIIQKKCNKFVIKYDTFETNETFMTNNCCV